MKNYIVCVLDQLVQVSIVERDEREEQNLMTRRNTRDQQLAVPEPHPLSDYYDRLTFHTNCGTHAQVITIYLFFTYLEQSCESIKQKFSINNSHSLIIMY